MASALDVETVITCAPEEKSPVESSSIYEAADPGSQETVTPVSPTEATGAAILAPVTTLPKGTNSPTAESAPIAATAKYQVVFAPSPDKAAEVPKV